MLRSHLCRKDLKYLIWHIFVQFYLHTYLKDDRFEDLNTLFWHFHFLCHAFSPSFDLFLLLISPSTGGLPLAAFNLGKVRPYQRGFFCNDDSIKYPFHHSTITSTVLYTVGFSLPISCVSRNHSRHIWHMANILTCQPQV